MRAAERQLQLLKDISLLAKVQQESPMAPYAISATTIVQAALARLETQINETEAQVDMVPDLPVIQANQKWACQAIYQLVSNALKYTADDHPPEVQIAPYDGPKGIGFIIKDRGPGVKPEHAERIWVLFQRAVGREIEGTGAGLAIVRQIAERHGGHAWLQPRDGGGAEFMITFGPVKAEIIIRADEAE
jgi:signal transduction histidine kinase